MKLTQYISLLLLTGAAASVVSCTEMDDYLRFTEGVSSTYTGKLDSAVFLAGNGRLLFHGELSSDPKVSRIGLYWNVGTKQDSLSIEVDYAKDKIVEKEIALGEGSYNFQIYTYDSAGNHSIPMTRSGNSYGANYLEGLYNRVVKSCALDGEDIAIEWYSGSENSPYTVVTYTGADGKPVEVQVGPKEEQTRLPQVRENQFKVQSVYLPEENAIDLFRPEAKLYFVSDITSLYLKNAGPNIQGAEKPDGSPWGVPKDWNITPNLRNQVNNTVGGWKDEQYEQYKGLIHFESQDWGGRERQGMADPDAAARNLRIHGLLPARQHGGRSVHPSGRGLGQRASRPRRHGDEGARVETPAAVGSGQGEQHPLHRDTSRPGIAGSGGHDQPRQPVSPVPLFQTEPNSRRRVTCHMRRTVRRGGPPIQNP